MDTNPRQQPTSNKGANYSNEKVANYSKTCHPHDFPGQPAGNDADEQDDQQVFIRHMHHITLAFVQTMPDLASSR
jgi:hypothetical protein